MPGKVIRIDQAYAARAEAEARRDHYEKPKQSSHAAYPVMHDLAHAHGRFEMASALFRLGDEIVAALRRAEERLEPDDDDLAMADEFALPTIDTRVAGRAVAHGIVLAAAMHNSSRLLIPRFEAAADGAVGLHWKSQRVELLVSVPTDRDAVVVYYGDVPSGKAFIKGAFREDEPAEFLAEWLVRHELPR